MQFFTMRYNLKFRKLTFFDLTRAAIYQKIETNLWANDFK